MKFGIIGLGRMGEAIAYRVIKAGLEVVGFDLSEVSQKAAADIGVQIVASVTDVAKQANIIWLMVPAGDPVDAVINELLPHLQPDTIIIDGGNSNFNNTMRRAKILQEKNIHYLDCGTSGGLKGREIGFSLMIGGDESAFKKVEQFFKAIATKDGYGLLGPSGAGHYVKMVHNGIEYAMLQALGEGLHLIKDGSFKDANIDLEKVTSIWANGSVIRSWLVELAQEVFAQDQKLENISGEVAEGGTGKWTFEDAQKHKIPVPALEESLRVRRESRDTGGNYGTKVVAMLRKGFGGHAVKKN